MSEGILTLERKDQQRQSKTALLLALKEDVIALRKELHDERELTAKLTAWIQTTLKPSLVQLRNEQLEAAQAMRKEHADAADAATARAQAAAARTQALEERHEALLIQLQQTRTAVNTKFVEVERDAAAATQAACAEVKRAADAAVVAAALETSRAAAAALKDAVDSTRTWTTGELARASAEHTERMRALNQTMHDERIAWQQSVAQQHAQLAATVASSVEGIRAQVAASHADVEQRLQARVEAQKQWEAKKELWMSSFLKDSSAALERAVSEWNSRWSQWSSTAEQLRAQDAAAVSAKLTLLVRDTSTAQDEQRREWERKHDAQLAAQIRQVVEWQRTSAAADKEWKGVVWETITQWQERYGPVIRQFVASERAKVEQSANEVSAATRANFPVPQWMTQLLAECGMERYASLLCSHGFDTPSVVMALDERDLDRLGASAIPLGHAKALLLHIRSKQMAADQQEERERQQLEYEEAKARLKAELDEEWRAKMDAVTRLAEASAAEAGRMEALRIDMEQKDRNMAAVTSQLEHITGLLMEQKQREAPVVVTASKEEVHELRTVAPRPAAEPAPAPKEPAAAAAPKVASTPAARAPTKAKDSPAKAASPAAAVAPTPLSAKPAAAAATAKQLKAAAKSVRPVPPPPAAAVVSTPALSEAELERLIAKHGEKEPRGPRYRVLYRSLCVDGVDGAALALAVAALQASGRLVVGGAAGDGTFHGSEVLTWTPRP